MRTLVMTMLDLTREQNQRTHQVARMVSEFSTETVIVTKVKITDRAARSVLRDALHFGAQVSRAGSITTIALHPPLNYAQALAAGLVQGAIVERPPLWRRALATLLSLAGIIRDLVLVPSFVLTVLVKGGGRFDLCIVEGPWSGTSAVVLRALGRVRHIVYDDIDHVAGGQMLAVREAYVAALETAAMRRADLVVSAGWLLGEHRRKTTGRAVQVIPNGADPARFAAALDRKPHPPTLVYVGHLAHYAGVDLAISALPAIAARVPGVRLLVIGGGDAPYIAGLRALAAAEGVADRVDLRGPVPYDQVPGVLAESDLGLSTFRLTPLGAFAFPLKVIEYMAAGLPVLCTRETEAEQILLRYPAGRAVSFTPQSLAEATIELLTDADAYRAAHEVALAASKVFTWERAMDDQRKAILAIEGLPVSLPVSLPASVPGSSGSQSAAQPAAARP